MRSFSTSSALRYIKWRLNGTTVDIAADLHNISKAVEASPLFAGKVEKGVINGDPHATVRGDGTVDPVHISGIIGRGNLKGSGRVTSFHFYLLIRILVFSDPQYPAIQVPEGPLPAAESSSAAGANLNTPPRHWVWDDGEKRYRFWDGGQWIWL